MERVAIISDRWWDKKSRNRNKRLLKEAEEHPEKAVFLLGDVVT